MRNLQKKLSLGALLVLTACGGDSNAGDTNPSTTSHERDASHAADGPPRADTGAATDSAVPGGGARDDLDAGRLTDADTSLDAGSLGDVEPLLRGSREALSVPRATDLNPDPHVIEINLDAHIASVDIGSQQVKMYTFNGQVPGPRIEANVGDRLIVHFTNHLPVETMIHWHGVRVPNAMDGTPLVQAGVKTGGTFDYSFVLTDPGIYWYHPHLDSSEQLMRGLYAPIIVHEPSEPVGLGEEVTLVLSDLAFSSPGVAGFPDDGAAALAAGRDGTTVLVNGQEPRTLLVQPGARLRMRVINTAANRFFKLRIEGHQLTRIGSDGGLAASATTMYYLLLASAERADLLVVPKGKAGDRFKLQAIPYDRGTGGTADPVPLLTLQLVGGEAEAPSPLPARLRAIEPLSTSGATKVAVKIERLGNEYMINGATHHAPPVVGKVGETQHWRVSNITYYDHPFHIHGFFFQVLNPRTNAPVLPLEWRDTVNIPQSAQLELLVKYDDRPGRWMYHCHILDHVETGFMGMLNVE